MIMTTKSLLLNEFGGSASADEVFALLAGTGRLPAWNARIRRLLEPARLAVPAHPRLRTVTADIMDPASITPAIDGAVIAADPAYWSVATNALVRVVVYDGLGLDHPAVSTLLEVLAPIAEADLAHGEAADAAMYQASRLRFSSG
jgi:hypothetical protein